MSFNQIDFENNLNNYSNEELCEIIICYRYLNFNKPAAIISMSELANRREQGSAFLFEDYIDLALKELPQITFNVPDIRNII